MSFEPVRPNRIDRTEPRPVWLVPQQDEWRKREHLEITHEVFRLDHTASATPGLVIRQDSQVITLLPEHLDQIFRVLRSAEAWRDDP